MVRLISVLCCEKSGGTLFPSLRSTFWCYACYIIPFRQRNACGVKRLRTNLPIAQECACVYMQILRCNQLYIRNKVRPHFLTCILPKLRRRYMRNPCEQCPTLRNGSYMWGSLCALSPEVRKTPRVVVQKDLRSEGILTGWRHRGQNAKNVR